jgi:murein DD-endopeptidase MepM/ murein hydrolase activator NlpD
VKLRRPTALPIDPWPTPDRGYATARVTSPFGPRGAGFHGALDIGNGRLGDAVVAAGAGRVLAAGNLREPWSEPTTRYPSGNFGGTMVVLEHAPGIVTIYAHLAPSLAVTAGELVAAGAPLGAIGDTGSAAPPPLGGGGHLHFGLQAPAEAVPAGVATEPTHYGYGLDVDPWPFIAGEKELAAMFTDVRSTRPDRPAIEWAAEQGLIRGVGRGEFAPDRALTRAELAVILERFNRWLLRDRRAL